MLLSIIVPVFNIEHYIEQCLQSIIHQMDENCELIIIDDGSSDESATLAEQLLNSTNNHNWMIIHQENKGLGGARNTGLNIAKGEYVIFVDGDDCLMPNAISSILYFIEHYPETDIIEYNLQIIYYNGQFGEKLYYLECEEYISNKKFINEAPSACNKVIKKELFTRNNLYFPEKKYCEDLGTIPILTLYASKILKIPNVLYIYRLRQNSIMRSRYSKSKFNELCEMVDRVITNFKLHNSFTEYYTELEYLCVEHILFESYINMICSEYNKDIHIGMYEYLNTYFNNYIDSELVHKKMRTNYLYSCICKNKNRLLIYFVYYCSRLKKVFRF